MEFEIVNEGRPFKELFSSRPKSLGRRARLFREKDDRHHDAAEDQQAAGQEAEPKAQRDRVHSPGGQLVLDRKSVV